MAASLEDILVRLLVPDNTVLLQATNEIRQAIKDPAIIPALCSILVSSTNVQVRQYAAILLRRKVYRLRQWNKVQDDIKNGLKQCLLHVLHVEAEKLVKNAVTQLIGRVARFELPLQRWPELLQILNQYIVSTNINEKEAGHFILDVVSSEAGEQLKPYFVWLLGLFTNSLKDTSSQWVPFHTIKTMANLVPYIGTDEMNKFQPLIPDVMNVIKKLILVDEDRAREALEIFEELMESEVGIIVPHIKNLVEICLEITASQALENSTRVKAMSILRSIIRLKKKSVIKHKLINPLLEVLFPIMCVPLSEDTDDADEDDEDEDEDDEDSQQPATFSPQVINVMALHLPPEKFIPHLMHHVEPALNSNNPYPKKASYVIVGVMAEGCSEYIRKKHLERILQVICRGITDGHPAVRNAALFALGQFAEFLQPDISMFANDIMPLLFQYLSDICQVQQQGGKTPPSLTRTFYALEMFCENLEDEKLLPFLPTLMERLMVILSVSQSVQVKELAISAIGAAANAAKEAMVPYFSRIIEFLTPYIKENQTDHTMPLQVQSIDTLGVLARTIGAATFSPMAEDCIKLGLELLEKVDDPDLRRSVYGLFASVSTVVKEAMADYLPVIFQHMNQSLLSTEGVEPQYCEDHGAFLLFDDVDDDDGVEDIANSNDDEDEDGIQSYSVTNSYVDEKEDTCCAMREIASSVGSAFLPFFEESFDVVSKLTEHPSEDIRRSAMTCLGQFCITLHKSQQQQEALRKTLVVLIPKLISTIREDTERAVVLAALETLNDMLKEIKQAMVDEAVLEGVVILIGDAFKHKFACQDEMDDEDSNAQEAEYDGMLLEFAGDLIPSLARAIPHNITPYIDMLLPFIISKTSSRCTVAERSFGFGTLAEIADALGKTGINPFIDRMLSVFLEGVKDEDDEVRSNSYYGLGLVVENAGPILVNRFPLLLQVLSSALMKEDGVRAKDNICAAVARMILVDANAVPLPQVFPVFLKCLPLKADFEENPIVYRCICELYSRRHEQVIHNLPEIIRIISVVIESKQVNDETRAHLVALVKSIYQEFQNDFTTFVQSLSNEGQQALSKALAS